MTTEISDAYVARCAKTLGQLMGDAGAVARWCYNNPPRRAIPKATGERMNTVLVSRKVWSCLITIARASDNGEGHIPADAIADSLLAMSVKDLAPAAWSMHERHEQEREHMLAELRRSEPTLEREEA